MNSNAKSKWVGIAEENGKVGKRVRELTEKLRCCSFYFVFAKKNDMPMSKVEIVSRSRKALKLSNEHISQF